MDCIYCTPEWLEETSKIYQSTPRFQQALKRLSVWIFFRITAEPVWGIDPDIIFGVKVMKGMLEGLRFYSEDEVKVNGDLVMAASPQEWKLLLRKEHKFITDFMLGKIKLERGNITGVLGVAPYADAFIDALTQVKLVFQDEFSAQQLNDYREYASQFRSKLSV
jgi:hypothetical protein